MPIGSSPDFEKRSFEIKNDDKFFSRLLTKETSKTNPSFRVYYGDVPGTVPFMWETSPGTPKHHSFYDTSLIPPLTPPPYYSTNINKPIKRNSRSKLLYTLLRRINPKKVNQFGMSSSSSSSMSWSTSSHATFSPSCVHEGRRQFSRRGTMLDDDHQEVCPSRLSLITKKALLSIVGHRSG
ncbi:Hypothetical predicted protein [Olea europaea subsp. europaea]|uniref:Uncharacterized protein n=1 Tax=Olea europaea subsp. europaea TaxID=158383 RepID=A0A8S0P8E7_OLEEU|nr:Hypothetical predicted protein [Olea europaea subsp. europaea]